MSPWVNESACPAVCPDLTQGNIKAETCSVSTSYSGASPLHACRSSTSFCGFESSMRSPSTPDFSCMQVACMVQQACQSTLLW